MRRGYFVRAAYDAAGRVVVSRPDWTLSPPPAPDSIDQRLVDAKARPPGILPYGPVSLLDAAVDQVNASLDPLGLKIGFSYTALYQAATGGPGQRDAAGRTSTSSATGDCSAPKAARTTAISTSPAEWRDDMGTGIAPGALGGQIGSLWGTTNGFGEQPITLKEIYWEQHFGGDELIFRAGKLDPENYYNSNYWQSDSKYFLNKAFSSFPVRAFPGQGLGVNLTLDPQRHVVHLHRISGRPGQKNHRPASTRSSTTSISSARSNSAARRTSKDSAMAPIASPRGIATPATETASPTTPAST